ncbi:MAG TPA: PIN domain-containing protein [Bryobacteraceae bacterium]|jgi:predicted nucleic acid-binding protein|nr:PIN domain-containing protein [Bryobacteraceae bacterium]
MPGDSVFVDTNVLLYSFDSRHPSKNKQATHWLDYLWGTSNGRMSWQVLNEFYENAVRKFGVLPSEARKAVSVFSMWQPSGIDFVLVQRAWHWMDHAHLSYWDSLILASAERLGCSLLLSEDFQDGREYGAVRVVSPFTQQPQDLPPSKLS